MRSSVQLRSAWVVQTGKSASRGYECNFKRQARWSRPSLASLEDRSITGAIQNPSEASAVRVSIKKPQEKNFENSILGEPTLSVAGMLSFNSAPAGAVSAAPVMLLSPSITNVMWCFRRRGLACSLGADDIHPLLGQKRERIVQLRGADQIHDRGPVPFRVGIRSRSNSRPRRLARKARESLSRSYKPVGCN